MLKTKLVLSIVLVLCFVSALLPVSAAQIPLDDVTLPKEGVAVTSGRNLWESVSDGVAKDLLIILSLDDSLQFVNKAGRDNYVGLIADFTLTYDQATAPEGAPTTFTVEACPVMHSRAAGSGELCLGFAPADIVECSPELFAMSGKSLKELLGTDQKQNPFTVTDMVVYKGTWNPQTIDTGAFAEGTVFLSHETFLQFPSNWLIESRGSNTVYENIAYRNVKYVLSDGPVQYFVAEANGTYNVWAQLFTNQSNADRGVVITINGEKYTFDPTKVSTSEQTSTLEPLWYTANDNKTVTLKAGDVVAVQISVESGRYGNLGTIAMVPTASNATVKAELEKDRTVEHVTPLQVTNLMPPVYKPSFDEEYATVTVNGTSVKVKAGTGIQKVTGSAGFVSTQHSDKRVLGMPITLRDNEMPTYVTAADAVAAYILETQTTSSHPYDAAVITGPFGHAITVNKQPVIAGWHHIKDGDVITIEERTKDNFEPVMVGGMNNIFSVIGGLSSGTNIEGAASKFCLSSSNLANYAGSFSTKKDATGLKDCYLSGYVLVTKDGENSGLSSEKSKIFFENVRFLDFNSSHGSGRIDMIIDKVVNLGNAEAAFYTLGDGTVLRDSNNLAYHKPHGLVTRATYYDFSNLYITNTYATGELDVVKRGNTYTVSTDSARLVDVIRVTYNGKNVQSVVTNSDQMIMFNEPLKITVANNEKVFVWDTRALEGITMTPACEALLGSDFITE